MKKLALLLTLFACGIAYAVPSRLIDGKPQPAVAEVNGTICWTLEEKAAAVSYVQASGTETLTTQDYAKDSFEVSVATSGLKFENYSDFKRAVASKPALEDKLDDMPPSDRRKNRRTVDYLELENSRR